MIEFAREMVQRSPAADRIELIAGDFFGDDLPEADLYSVGQILHDWSEDKIERLLDKISGRLPAGGGLLIAEKLLDPDKKGPVAGHMQSLNMLICTEGKSGRSKSTRRFSIAPDSARFAASAQARGSTLSLRSRLKT